MGRSGSRGGSVPSVAQAQQLFQEWKRDEWGWLKCRILWLAERHGEYHADMIADLELSQPNIIGALVNSLQTQGYLVSTGEHRKGKSEASHGRRSYVYRCTDAGQALALALNIVPRDRLPHRPSERLVEVDEPKPQTQREPRGRHLGQTEFDLDAYMEGIREANRLRALRDSPEPLEPEEDATLRWDAS